MVLKNSKWNISKDKGEEYAHRYIIEILNDSKWKSISNRDVSAKLYAILRCATMYAFIDCSIFC